MKRVISMRSKLFLGGYYLRSNSILAELVMFLVGAVLTLLAPALLYSLVIEQPWPLYLMGCNVVLGFMLGLIMFKSPSDGFPSCVPLTLVPDAPSGTKSFKLKKAA
jgi:hypothetical protein